MKTVMVAVPTLIEMQFLEDVEVECESCNGQRFNEETLQIRYNGKNIHEVLEPTIEEALSFSNTSLESSGYSLS